MFDDREHVAWDIETTGFSADSLITVSGFWWPHGSPDVILNTDSNAVDAGQLEADLETISGGVNVTVHPTDDEPALLDKMAHLMFEKFDQSRNRIIAVNGETWKGGFDLPFLRVRCLKHGSDWMFDGIQYTDVLPTIRKRLNTTHAVHDKSLDLNTLVGSHSTLFNGIHSLPDGLDEAAPEDHTWYTTVGYDPFESSGSAVTAFRTENYRPLLQHNLADIHRTWELGEVAREFTPGKDLSGKKL